MKFDKILQYQKIDQELMALENEVAKSDERQKLAVAKSRLEGATDMIGKLKGEASDLLAGYAAMKEKIDALKAELDEFDGILEDVQDANEADHYLKMVSSIAEKINALEKEANSAAAKIDQVNDSYKKTWDQGVKATDVYKSAKAEYDNLVRKFQPRVVEIKTQLNALKAEIPENVMNAYLALRAAKKMPAFVAYDRNSGVCGRCFMDVPNDTKSKLRKEGDYAECPNCRRILYVADEQ